MAEYPTPPGDSLEPLTAELKNLQRQLNDLQRASGTDIGETLRQIQDQQAALEAAQGKLTVPAVASGANAVFALSTGWANVVQVALNVPVGYTRALFYASGVVVGGNNDALTVAKVYSRIIIGAAVGPETIVPIFEPWAAAPAFAASAPVGISGTILVTIQGRLHAGATSAGTIPWTNASLVAQATFLR